MSKEEKRNLPNSQKLAASQHLHQSDQKMKQFKESISSTIKQIKQQANERGSSPALSHRISQPVRDNKSRNNKNLTNSIGGHLQTQATEELRSGLKGSQINPSRTMARTPRNTSTS